MSLVLSPESTVQEAEMGETEFGPLRRPAIYARVSTEEQAQTGTSLETQVQSLRAELLGKGGMEPMVFVDDGYSGTTAYRPGLMDLEQAVTEGRVSEVRVASLDRLARDLVLQETLLNRWRSNDVRFGSQREPDLGEADPTRILIRQVLGAIAQYERAVIAVRMQAGRIARAQNGYWPGGKVPYGYSLEGEPPRPVLEAEKAKNIREAGMRALAGERVTHIAKDFNSRGIPGPGGNGWEPTYLSRLLRNPAYKGEGRYGIREYVEPKQYRSTKHAISRAKSGVRFRPEKDWLLVPMPELFSSAEWEAIQTALKGRGKPQKETGEYLVSRRFRSACGAGYLGNFNNGKPRYLCHHRITRKQKVRRDCGCPAIAAWEVDAAVWESVAETLANPDRLLTAAREELRRRGMAHSEEKLQRELRSVDKRLNQAREALGRLIRYHAEKATLDDTIFEAAARPLQVEVAELEQQRDQLATALPGPRLQADQEAIKKVASEIIGRLDELSFVEKQRIVALLDVQVRLRPDGHVTASMAVTVPGEESHAKVLNRTSFRSLRRTSARSLGA